MYIISLLIHFMKEKSIDQPNSTDVIITTVGILSR